MPGFPDDIPFFDEEPARASRRAAGSRSGAAGGIAARAMAARAASTGRPTISTGLNPEQRAAVETTRGPGAGACRRRHRQDPRADHPHRPYPVTGRAFPSQILAVTFTNKAAREMKERIGVLVGGAVEGMPWLGTFHSIGVKLLRRHAELVGLKSDFTILDTDDVVRLIKQIIQAEGLDDKRWPAKQFALMIDGWKNKGLGPAEIPEGDARAFANGKGRELYTAYQNRLKTLNACDFGDLLLPPDPHVPRLSGCAEGISRQVPLYPRRRVSGHQHRAIYVAAAARPASSKRRWAASNICCVGDDDQSIYGWRGAEVDNILRFEKDFPGAMVIRLERNYRSTAHILGAAVPLIAHNEGRLGKTLFTDRDQSRRRQGQGPRRLGFRRGSPRRRRGNRAAAAQEHMLNDMAILVRASFQMREFEDRFVTLGLNYRVIGGPRFYERLEIRDALAYFRVVAQPADDLAFERIVNTPKRGLGEATMRASCMTMPARAISPCWRRPPTSSKPTS